MRVGSSTLRLLLLPSHLQRTLTSPPSSKNSSTFAMSPSFTEVWMSTLRGFGGAAILSESCRLCFVQGASWSKKQQPKSKGASRFQRSIFASRPQSKKQHARRPKYTPTLSIFGRCSCCNRTLSLKQGLVLTPVYRSDTSCNPEGFPYFLICILVQGPVRSI